MLVYAHIREDGTIQTCAAHSRAAAQYAGDVLAGVNLFSTAYLAGLMHDAGKFTQEFMDYIRQAVAERMRRGSVIHTFAGVRWFLEKNHRTSGSLDYADIAAELLAVAVGAHHGFFDLYAEDGRGGFLHRLHKQPEYDRRALDAFFSDCAAEAEVQALFERAVAELTPVLEQLSNSGKDDGEVAFLASLLARLLTSAVVEGDRRDTAEFMSGMPVKICPEADRGVWHRCSCAIAERLAGFASNTPIAAARSAFSEACLTFAAQPDGIYRLDLPTGGGKTLAGLRYAVAHAEQFDKRRIIYVAPLLSIIEQNADEIRKALGGEVEVLEHHSNLVQEDKTEETLARTELLQQTWDTPVIITTLVQLLDTLFSGKMSCVRRFKSLCNSVIIFDEIQSLPEKTISMFNLAMSFLTRVCGVTIVLCSATQPVFEDTKHSMPVSERPILPRSVAEEYAPLFRRTQLIDAGSRRLEDVPAFIEEILSNTQSLLVVCNTKREAEMLFGQLDIPDVLRFHLSAGMCMAHRRRELDALRTALDSKAPKRLVCIATQVIEAGIDISFSAVVRFSAGLDNVVQAAGRCNRHGESSQPQPVYILRISDEKLGSLEQIKRAQDALNALLAEYRLDPNAFGNNLASKASVDYYYKYLFDHMKQGLQDYPLAHRPSLFEMLSENTTYAAEGEQTDIFYMRQAFRTAGSLFEVFDSGTGAVVVPYGEGEAIIAEMNSQRAKYDIGYAQELLARAKDYSVSMYADAVRRLRLAGVVYDIPALGVSALLPNYYDKHTGVVSAAKEEMAECSSLIL